ncbi:hypothetical protein Tco_1407715 [Tanacetum coccineum]
MSEDSSNESHLITGRSSRISEVTPTKPGEYKAYRPALMLTVYAGLFKDGGVSIKVKEFQRSFRHSDTERLSRSDKVLKLKNFKKDATLKLSKSTNQEWIHKDGDGSASFQLKSDSLPHAHAQTTKT